MAKNNLTSFLKSLISFVVTVLKHSVFIPTQAQMYGHIFVYNYFSPASACQALIFSH